MGMALMLAVPFLALILIRMLWSGSTLWFLMAGIIFLGAAAIVFLARRNEPAYGYQTLTPEPNRLPLVLLGLGVLFLALLVLPNVSGDSSSPVARLESVGGESQITSTLPTALPAVAQQPTQRSTAAVQPTPVATAVESEPVAASNDEPTSSNPPEGSQVYVVEDGDTLWDIALAFDTTVDDILAANDLENADDLQLGDELVIPPPSDAGTTAAESQ